MPPPTVGNFSDNDDPGKTGLFMLTSSYLDRRDVDPAPLAPALQGAFGQLHALHAFQQRELVRRVLADVANEHLPLLLAAVVVAGVLLPRLPVGIEVVGTLLVRIPNRSRRRLPGLDHAIAQARHRRTVDAVNLKSHEIVAI